MAPDYATYYEVALPFSPMPRLAQIDRDNFTELRSVNLSYLRRTLDLQEEVADLLNKIENDRDILFITEGLTDWRHMIRALRHFHESGEFENVLEEYFLRFGTQNDVDHGVCDTDCFVEMGDGTLKKYLEGLIASRKVETSASKKLRVGIFDSDKGGETPNNDLLNIRSFKIQPDGISIEFLYSPDELETAISRRKLYIGKEFSEETLRHNSDATLSLGKNSRNDAGKNKIIDDDVFDASGSNIALPKAEFANYAYNGELEISEESFDRFRHIFEELSVYINEYQNQP